MRTPRNVRQSSLILAGAALVALALVPACGKQTAFEPLAPAGTSHGAVVAGQVKVLDASAGAGVVVTLERIEGGVSATVRRVMDAASAHAATRTVAALRAVASIAPRTGGDPARAGGPSTAGAVRATVTDALGRYAFADVAPGDYLVTGSERNQRAGSARMRVVTALTETTFVNISL